MPPSVFRGRIVASGESLWLDSDRAEALAFVADEHDRCAGCGQPRSESTKKESAGRYTVQEFICKGCVVVSAAGRNSYAGQVVAVVDKRA